MKILSHKNSECAFEFATEELELFFHILHLYPCTPTQSFQKLSKFSDEEDIEEGQELLDEALAEQKAENRKLIEAFVTDEKRFQRPDDGVVEVIFLETEMDWLLQILNDIRVGLWMKLGSPEEEITFSNLDPSHIQDYSMMQLSGEFQGFFLHSLNS